MAYDLLIKNGAKRMVMSSRAVEYTIVNGSVAYAEGRPTGSTSGQVLRS